MKNSAKVRIAILAASAISLAPGTTRANKPLTVTVARLTLGTALKMARGAISACRHKGFQVTATVVDRNGITQVVLRDTIAAPLSLAISYDKAYTSAMFNAKGTVMQKETRHAPLSYAGAHLLFVGGSIPIEAGGVFYGAIGVSGTPSAQTDEDCAAAGLKTVHQALEMQ
ncbi:MAG: GlcG/HbpS family heme-binding protein [Gammaproteobacteria bacterium]